MNDAIIIPTQEIVTLGIQKKTTRNIWLPDRLAMKNSANKRTAKIQKRGETTALQR